jgi:hypothetical protein
VINHPQCDFSGAVRFDASATNVRGSMSRRMFQLPGRPRRDGQEPAPGALLTDQQHELIAEELALHGRLADTLERYPASEEDRGAIARASDHLTALFMLVIVGEFNAGKSAFINALVGANVMPEGVTPTTSVINLLRFGPEATVTIPPSSSTRSPSSTRPGPTPSSGSTRR